MIKIGIIGAAGYTGIELIRLLNAHPEVNLSVVTSEAEAGKSVASVFPNLRTDSDLLFTSHDNPDIKQCDTVFFATPHATAMRKVADLLDAGIKIIDLSADFRLTDPAVWKEWYGVEHAAPELLAEAVYGLPEINRENIKQANLISNPGCYPTASILALLPALKADIIDPGSIIIDAKSGYTGAGRKAVQQGLFSEVSESFKAYGLPRHRHYPEIHQILNSVSDQSVEMTFVPHLLPINRGILATVYVKQTTDTDIQSCYESFYREEPFVEVLESHHFPSTRSARGSNICSLSVEPDTRGPNTVIVAVIDNLVKGAAGQAIQNMNIMYGYDEQMGLSQIGFYP